MYTLWGCLPQWTPFRPKQFQSPLAAKQYGPEKVMEVKNGTDLLYRQGDYGGFGLCMPPREQNCLLNHQGCDDGILNKPSK